MSEKRLYSYDKSNNTILCNLNDVCDFNISNVFQLLNSLSDENKQLKERNEKLQWELDKTREDLNCFANPKITAIRGSDCGHDRCYVTSMQKKR